MKINIEDLIQGYNQVSVYGRVNTPYREKRIKEAIAYFQENPKPDRKENFGIKNYDGFGDQRCDCEPGYGPKHGVIVFTIDYNRYVKDLTIDNKGINFLLTALFNPQISLSHLIGNYIKVKENKENFDGLQKELANLHFKNINE
jgi:hypothetical protein